jgi:multiple sugar transport system substrate-binding protein
MNRHTHWAIAASTFAAVAVVAQGAYVASSSAAIPMGSTQNVTISVNCEPTPGTEPGRTNWIADQKTFMKENPGVKVVSDDENPCDNPNTYYPKLASGNEESVFYSYLTDIQESIATGQVADIQQYLPKNDPAINDIQSSVLNVFKGKNGDLYGLPAANYTMGLVYDKVLFQEAGLNPNDPPTTWAGVRADAKKISALGNGIVGYADYSIYNQGGWHFTAEMYSDGGADVTPNGKHADFNNAIGTELLQNLYNMRWVDNSMGTQQLLDIPIVQGWFGANKVGMLIGAPDNIPAIVQTYGGKYQNYGLGALPGLNGPAASTLLGGDGMLFNVHDTPAQIEAGIKWAEFEYLTPGVASNNWARASAQKQEVGLPEPDLWTGSEAKLNAGIQAKYANVPPGDFAGFEHAMLTMKSTIEPPDAQSIYSVLDTVMSTVLTDKNASIPGLLKSAASKVNTVLDGYWGD